MKRLLFIATASLACISAFAQGRVSFANDSLHLVYYDPIASHLPPEDAFLAGSPVYAGNMPLGTFLVADFYVGTSSSSLSLITTTTFGNHPGLWNPVSVAIPGLPGGTTVFGIAQIREEFATPPALWTPASPPIPLWYGRSEEFSFTLGTLTYPPIGGPPGGPWPIGDYVLDPYGLGFRGAIMVAYIPEPSTFALFLVGLPASILFIRKPLISRHFKLKNDLLGI